MTPPDILDYLSERGITVAASITNDGIDVRGPLSELTAPMLNRLRAREAEIAAYLRAHESHTTRRMRQVSESAMETARAFAAADRTEYKRPPIDGACVRVDRALECGHEQ
jgi:acetoin utilization deacetylase AcuC-like enzyme